MKKAVYFLCIALAVSLMCNYLQYTKNDVKTDTVTIERTDTQYISRTDTMPIICRESVLSFVEIPVMRDSVVHDTLRLDIVQRTYTDDTTYTAYVSGLQYGIYPVLDSISVMQKVITKETERIVSVQKKNPWNVGVQIGAGVGIVTRQPDIYIGVGLQYHF